jgi:hypothetical protein
MAISEFQLSIIALGVVGVAGVFAYNKWQERKYRKQTERAFDATHADILLEPGETAGPAGAGASRDSGIEERIEPVESAQMGASPAVAEESAPVAEPGVPLVHPAADCVVRFEAAEAIASPQLWQAAGEVFAGIDKPVRLLAWNENRAAWQILQSHSALTSRQWRITLQLADRRGALGSGGIDLFLGGVRQLADRFMAVTDFPERRQLAGRAQDLDKFCAGVDVQIGIHIVANDAAGFPGTKLRGIAEAAGMALGDDGMFHARDDTGHELYTMGNLEPALFVADTMTSFVSHGLTFNLDVPCVMNGGAAFAGMVTAARQLAAGLNGTVVDDNRAPLTQQALDMIRAKIVEFQDVMAKHGIAAGSATALRLFE